MFRTETHRVEADLREWTSRDATVAATSVAIQDSGRLLAGMETQTRAGLDQEVEADLREWTSRDATVAATS